MELRANGVTMPVLILGHTPKEQVGRLIEHHITQAVTCKAKALEYSREAAALGGTLKIHIKVDTGMGRIGFRWDEAVEAVLKIAEMPGIRIEGLYTHFATADEGDKDFTHLQLMRYAQVVKALSDKGVEIPLKHVENSALSLILIKRFLTWCVRASFSTATTPQTGEKGKAWAKAGYEL